MTVRMRIMRIMRIMQVIRHLPSHKIGPKIALRLSASDSGFRARARLRTSIHILLLLRCFEQIDNAISEWTKGVELDCDTADPERSMWRDERERRSSKVPVDTDAIRRGARRVRVFVGTSINNKRSRSDSATQPAISRGLRNLMMPPVVQT